MSKAEIILEIIVLLQGTPLDNFARENFLADGNSAVVRCATNTTLAMAEGQACKCGVATTLRRYSYRFTMAQLAVLADNVARGYWVASSGNVTDAVWMEYIKSQT
jgi:hypothetical protein